MKGISMKTPLIINADLEMDRLRAKVRAQGLEIERLKAQNAEDLRKLAESVELGTKQAQEFDQQLAYERERNMNNVANADLQIAQLKAQLAEAERRGMERALATIESLYPEKLRQWKARPCDVIDAIRAAMAQPGSVWGVEVKP